MPELPEIYNRAIEMKQHLPGRTITGIEVIQPKCLNLPEEEFAACLTGACIRDVSYHGKWLILETTQGYLLFNMGMGGEILLTNRLSLPEKRRLIFDLDGLSGDDRPCLSVNFWWFGYAHFVPAGQLDSHPLTAKLGPNAIDLSLQEFKALLSGQRSRLKSFLLDQSRLAGIGNAYIHDILFLAHLHPLRKIDSLTEAEIEGLYQAIHAGLQPSIDKGGAFYETGLLGQKGGFQMEDIIIGYREGTPCPNCAAPVEKIKTGSTSSFICPQCQPLNL